MKNLLIIGDSHTNILKKIYDSTTLNLKQKININILGVGGASISGLTKKESKKYIQKKVMNIIKKINKKNLILMINLGFLDITAIFIYKKTINKDLTFKKYSENVIKNYKIIINLFKKYRKIFILPMKNIALSSYETYIKFLKKNKYNNLLSENEKKKIFEEYDNNIKNINKKLKKLFTKNNIEYIDNSMFYNIFNKNLRDFSFLYKKNDHHYLFDVYLIIFLINIEKIFKINLDKDIELSIENFKNYMLKQKNN